MPTVRMRGLLCNELGDRIRESYKEIEMIPEALALRSISTHQSAGVCKCADYLSLAGRFARTTPVGRSGLGNRSAWCHLINRLRQDLRELLGQVLHGHPGFRR